MSKGRNSTHSEHGHAAYRIKGNHDCSDMVANILPAAPPPPPPTLGVGSIGQITTFSKHDYVSYQIKMTLGSNFNFFRTWSCCISNYYCILKDIHKLGLRGRLPQFIENFFNDRTMQVRVGSSLSDQYDTSRGRSVYNTF